MNYYLSLLLSIIITYYYFSSFSQYNDNQLNIYRLIYELVKT